MSYPTSRMYPRTLAAAFSDERAYCIETPNGVRMTLAAYQRQSLLRRVWRWFAG